MPRKREPTEQEKRKAAAAFARYFETERLEGRIPDRAAFIRSLNAPFQIRLLDLYVWYTKLQRERQGRVWARWSPREKS